jgi:uncharacterized protein
LTAGSVSHILNLKAGVVTLRFNVSTLLKEPVGSTREYEIDDRALVHEEGPEFRDVTGHARFLRTNEGILVSAPLHGVERQPCSRCLQEVEFPVDLAFEEVFYPASDINSGAALLTPEDADAFRLTDKWILDLEEPIRQFWTVALPMQLLCRPDCRGLCPQCGQDWNEGSCDCTPPADERWSALGTLLRK